ncbi:MAG: hypothetical protein Q8927_13340 [Bacteroidota bacterium]|nr:hypothetical protein [Bacteroidota bacterium]MDP4217180.1 hypothetical protein [Bacteroidota bacterium]MDP4245399.1 hypothetical protein [Bacteroidota bacterium]MDP4254203.1 hypothetical protein [Bacteroidota bacterium]MDP4259621.1 hypothetical protein [Bacteroidota bacterium]
MGVIKKIRYDCRHATYLIEKRQHRSLTIKERIELAIHLSGCSICRLFQEQSRWINRMLRSLFHSDQGRGPVISDEFKRQLQQKIDERLK